MSEMEMKEERAGMTSSFQSCATGGNFGLQNSHPFPTIKVQPLSSYLIDESAGFRPEENLKEPFRGFTIDEEEELYSKIDSRCDSLLTKVKKLSQELKSGVISAVKSSNGVIKLSRENPWANFVWKRLVAPQPSPPRQQQRGNTMKEKEDQVQQEVIKKRVPSEMEEDEELHSWKPMSQNSSSRTGRAIQPTKKYSNGDLLVIQETTRPQKLKRPSELVMGMLPPKYPKRMERSSPGSASDEKEMDVDYDFTSSDEDEPSGSTAVKAIPDDSFFQISAIHQSGEIDVNQVVQFLKAQPNPPQSQKVQSQEPVRNQSKQTCSVLCKGRGGKVPNLQCCKCLCLVHGACVGVPNLISSLSFICPTCYENDVIQKRNFSKEAALPATTMLPPPPPTSQTPAERMYFPSSRPCTSSNITMMKVPSKRKQPKEPSFQKPVTISRAPLNILSPSRPSWTLPAPPSTPNENRKHDVPALPQFYVAPPPRHGMMKPQQLRTPPSLIKIAPHPPPDALRLIKSGSVTLSLVPSPKSSPSPSPFKIPVGLPPKRVATTSAPRTFVAPSIPHSVTITMVPKRQESYAAATSGLSLLSMYAPSPRPTLTRNRRGWAVQVTPIQDEVSAAGRSSGGMQGQYFLP